MKAIRYSTYGPPPETADVVELHGKAPGPGEVQIAMEAAAVHLKELYMIEGIHGFRLPLPIIPGNSCVGRVLDLGEGVQDFQLGQRVWALYREPWIEQSGTWRERLNVPVARLHPAPQDVPAEQLAFVCNNLLSAYLLLTEITPLKAGDWMIHNAANSNCGEYMIGLARSWGLKSVNVVRREEVIEEVSRWGGDVVLLDGDDLADRVNKETGGAAISIGFDAVAGTATDRLASCVKEGKTVVNYGVAGGKPCQITPAQFLLRDVRVRGFLMDRVYFEKSLAQQRALLAELSEIVTSGTLRARIAGTYSLDRISEALAHQAKAGQDRPGKICLLGEA